MKLVRTYALAALLALPALCLFVPASGQTPPADPQPGIVGGIGGGGIGIDGAPFAGPGNIGVPLQTQGSVCFGSATAGRYTLSVGYGGPAGQAHIAAVADRINAAESFVGIPDDLVAEPGHALLTGAGSYKGQAAAFRLDIWQTGVAQRLRLILYSALGKEVKRISQALDAGTGAPVMIAPRPLPPGL